MNFYKWIAEQMNWEEQKEEKHNLELQNIEYFEKR